MKSIFVSKTFWFSVLQVATGLGLIVLGQEEAGSALITTGFGSLWLRLKTNTGISLK